MTFSFQFYFNFSCFYWGKLSTAQIITKIQRNEVACRTHQKTCWLGVSYPLVSNFLNKTRDRNEWRTRRWLVLIDVIHIQYLFTNFANLILCVVVARCVVMWSSGLNLLWIFYAVAWLTAKGGEADLFFHNL